MTERLTLTRASASIAIRKTEQRISTADELFEIAIQTLSQAVEMLREDVGHARDRADQAEHRVDQLLHDLADARTEAMISGCEAATLRSRLALLTDQSRRPWWRRWFR